MELCDYDLDHLVKVEPFKEETIIVFLYQLGKLCTHKLHIKHVYGYRVIYTHHDFLRYEYYQEFMISAESHIHGYISIMRVGLETNQVSNMMF